MKEAKFFRSLVLTLSFNLLLCCVVGFRCYKLKSRRGIHSVYYVEECLLAVISKDRQMTTAFFQGVEVCTVQQFVYRVAFHDILCLSKSFVTQ